MQNSARGLKLLVAALALALVDRCSGELDNATASTPSGGNASGATLADNATAATPAGNVTAATPAGNATSADNATAINATVAPTGKPKADFEYTTLKKEKLCIKGDEESIKHCANLKEEIISKFHKDRNLTDVEGGKCLYLTEADSNDTATTKAQTSGSKGHLRCVYDAKYLTKDKKIEGVRFHFFNNNGDPKGKGNVVMVMGYWGDANKPKVVETPLT